MKDFSKYDFGKFNPDEKYNLYIDADTIIYANAAAVSRDECKVTHKASKREKVFKNFDEFMDFLTNDERGSRFTLDDFDVPVIGFALANIRRKFETLLSYNWIADHKIYVGGEGNFRKDMYADYKGNRPPKPLLFPFCYNYVIGKYAGKVEMCHGFEAEDHCLADALADPRGVIAYVDKDLEGQSGLFFNYNKMELGVYFINKEQAFYNLCTQLLIGDRSTDNIKGIDFVSKALKEKYKISTKSIGAGTAAKLLEDVEHDITLMKQRIAEIYELSYGADWKQYLDFTGKLVFITKERGVAFDVNKFLEGTGIE